MKYELRSVQLAVQPPDHETCDSTRDLSTHSGEWTQEEVLIMKSNETRSSNCKRG